MAVVAGVAAMLTMAVAARSGDTGDGVATKVAALLAKTVVRRSNDTGDIGSGRSSMYRRWR